MPPRQWTLRYAKVTNKLGTQVHLLPHNAL